MKPPVDHLGRQVTTPKRPGIRTYWERADGMIPMLHGYIPSLEQAREIAKVKGDPIARLTERWRLRKRVLVNSSLVPVLFNGEKTWQWLVSISCFGKRASDEVCAQALRDFDMPNAEEDNHESGVARKFWRSCHLPPEAATECECKTDERVIVEPDGYTWSKET